MVYDDRKMIATHRKERGLLKPPSNCKGFSFDESVSLLCGSQKSRVGKCYTLAPLAAVRELKIAVTMFLYENVTDTRFRPIWRKTSLLIGIEYL